MHKSFSSHFDHQERQKRIRREAMEEIRRENEDREVLEDERRHNESLRWPS